METYRFYVAGISIRVQIDWPVGMTESYSPFLTDDDECLPDEQAVIRLSDQLPAADASVCWQHGFGYTEINGKNAVFRRLTETSAPYLLDVAETPNQHTVYYSRSGNEMPLDISKVFNDLGLESLLIRHQIMILHSSFIRWNGKGILFSAPSGTGKSTQAGLWERYLGAEILNGDRAGIYKCESTWTACGLPYAGSSDIFRNESAPAAAVVCLRQGKENMVQRLSPVQAVRKLMPEVTLHRWDRNFLEKGLDLLSDLVSSVPVWQLTCRPDRDAVELMRDIITQEV